MWNVACGCGYVGEMQEVEGESGPFHVCPHCGWQWPQQPEPTPIPTPFLSVLEELEPKLRNL